MNRLLNKKTIQTTKQFGLNQKEATRIYNQQRIKSYIEGDHLIKQGKLIKAKAKKKYQEALSIINEVYQ